VWGAVALWRRVVEHELGYRAEHAMIRRLVVPQGILIRLCWGLCHPELPAAYVNDLPGPPLVDALARRYGVDVELGDGFEIAVEN
jgi:hypothetical protein